MGYIVIKDAGTDEKVHVWEYIVPGEYVIIAGKSDKDNDLLSLKLANPNDWWFHARGMPGSHVLLKIDNILKKIDISVMKKAAGVAAFHSKGRNIGLVQVSGTLAKYVIKPIGAKLGTVQISREKIFKVRPSIPNN